MDAQSKIQREILPIPDMPHAGLTTYDAKTRFMHHARTPRAAAVAGILFGILFSCSIVLIRLATPPDITDLNAWTDTTRRMVSISLALISLAGVAFLWFIGVVRDRLGAYEDQFFATVFLGSGLLFLAMTFGAFAFAAGMFAALSTGGDQITIPDVYVVGRAVMSQMFNMYALKMAAVFMISLSTLAAHRRGAPLAVLHQLCGGAAHALQSLPKPVDGVVAPCLGVGREHLLPDHELSPGAIRRRGWLPGTAGGELSRHLFLEVIRVGDGLHCD